MSPYINDISQKIISQSTSVSQFKTTINKISKTRNNSEYRRIPRVIYQTWYTRNLSLQLKKPIDNMLKLNPSYGYKLFLDDEMEKFVTSNFDDTIVQCYKKLNLIVSKTDFWRYLILYKYGGVYLDIDSTIIKPLDKLISVNDEAIISAERKTGCFAQWALIFKKEHPILKKVIELIVNNILNGNCLSVHELTGPTVYSQAIREVYFERYESNANSIVHSENLKSSYKNHVDVTYYTLPKLSYETKDKNSDNNKRINDNKDKNFSAEISLSTNTTKKIELVRSSYRLYGADYHNFFLFKIPRADLIFDTNKSLIHWPIEQFKKPLLKNSIIVKEFKNKYTFKNYTIDNTEYN